MRLRSIILPALLAMAGCAHTDVPIAYEVIPSRAATLPVAEAGVGDVLLMQRRLAPGGGHATPVEGFSIRSGIGPPLRFEAGVAYPVLGTTVLPDGRAAAYIGHPPDRLLAIAALDGSVTDKVAVRGVSVGNAVDFPGVPSSASPAGARVRFEGPLDAMETWRVEFRVESVEPTRVRIVRRERDGRGAAVREAVTILDVAVPGFEFLDRHRIFVRASKDGRIRYSLRDH